MIRSTVEKTDQLILSVLRLGCGRPLFPVANLENLVFQPSEVFSNVGLVQNDVAHWIQSLAVIRALSRHPKTQWDIRHAKDHDASVLWCAFRDSCQAVLGHVVAVEKGHFR